MSALTIILSAQDNSVEITLLLVVVALLIFGIANYNKRKKLETEKRKLFSDLRNHKEQIEKLRLESLKFQLNPHTIIHATKRR